MWEFLVFLLDSMVGYKKVFIDGFIYKLSSAKIKIYKKRKHGKLSSEFENKGAFKL